MPQCLNDDVQEAVVLPCRPGRQVKVTSQQAAWQSVRGKQMPCCRPGRQQARAQAEQAALQHEGPDAVQMQPRRRDSHTLSPAHHAPTQQPLSLSHKHRSRAAQLASWQIRKCSTESPFYTGRT